VWPPSYYWSNIVLEAVECSVQLAGLLHLRFNLIYFSLLWPVYAPVSVCGGSLFLSFLPSLTLYCARLNSIKLLLSFFTLVEIALNERKCRVKRDEHLKFFNWNIYSLNILIELFCLGLWIETIHLCVNERPRTNFIKLFNAFFNNLSPGKHLQPSLLLRGMAGVYPSEAPDTAPLSSLVPKY
jgi:hypothetical protein